MTKKDIVAKLVKEAELPLKKATEVVNQFISDFSDSLSNGVDSQAKFIGVGTFKVYERKATHKKLPKTQEIRFIPAKNAIRYTAGSEVKEKVNTPEAVLAFKQKETELEVA